MAITQLEYEFLMGLQKKFANDQEIEIGPAPIKWTREVNSTESHDLFLIDYHRGKLQLLKYTLNERFRQTVCLIRLDTAGRHTNPDGIHFDGPHIHIYRDGFDDKFAYPVETAGIKDPTNIGNSVKEFLEFCNIRNVPPIQNSTYL